MYFEREPGMMNECMNDEKIKRVGEQERGVNKKGLKVVGRSHLNWKESSILKILRNIKTWRINHPHISIKQDTIVDYESK